MMGDTNTWLLLGIAFLNAITAALALITHKGLVEVGTNIALVEKNTNSMKDALVLATGRAEHAAGVTQGVAQGKADAEERAKT